MSYATIWYDAYENRIHFYEYDEAGERRKREYPYVPYFYLAPRRDPETPDAFSITGEGVVKKEFKSFFAYLDAKKRYKEQGRQTYEADLSPEVQFLLDHYLNDDLSGRPNHLNYVFFDIEVEMEGGLPDPENPEQRINLISLYSSRHDQIYTLGLEHDYEPERENVKYIRCDCEITLLRKFLEIFPHLHADVITGWNIDGFDIPYTINRIKRIINPLAVNKLSPVGKVKERRSYSGYGDETTYDIALVNVVDYMDLYKQFSQGGRESYSLEFIAQHELGEGKVDYEMSYQEFYREHWDEFVRYNIQDVDLLQKLEEKLGYLNLMVSISWFCKIPFDLVHTTLRKVDAVLYSFLKQEGRVIPDNMDPDRDHRSLMGGHVMESEKGLFEWISCFDISSLYPNLMMQFNISRETKRYKIDMSVAQEILGNQLRPFETDRAVVCTDTEERERTVSCNGLIEKIKAKNWRLAANGAIFSTDVPGAIPRVIDILYRRRMGMKAELKALDSDGEQASVLDEQQYALKIVMNSMYGYFANPYSKFFDIDAAEAITSTGQYFLKNAVRVCNEWFAEHQEALGQKLLGEVPPDGEMVKACDTDSVFVHIGRFVPSGVDDATKQRIVDFLNDTVFKLLGKTNERLSQQTFHVSENFIHFEKEYTARAMVFVAKKRYIALLGEPTTPEDDLKFTVKGMELVRSSTPHLIQDALKDICTTLLKTQDRSVIIEMMEEVRTTFYEEMQVEEIAFPTGVNNVEKYDLGDGQWKKGTPIHVKAAIAYNHLLELHGQSDQHEPIKSGDKMWYVYLRKNPIIKANCIGFGPDGFVPREFDLEQYVDYDKMFEKVFLNPLESIFEVIGWSLPDFNRYSLDSFLEW